MRKFALLALCATVVLSACNQDSPSPTEPSLDPDPSAAIRCIKPGFPVVLALEQIAGSRRITALYPKSNPRELAKALARVAEVAALWTFCKPAQAQAKVAAHTNILLEHYRTGKLVGGTSAATAGRVTTHTNTMWQGVGFQAPNIPVAPETGSNFGFGLFTPGTPLTVTTSNDDGAVQLPANSFSQPTLVTIVQRPNTPNPFEESGFQVFPPFYEIIASNASNTNYLAAGVFAVVGFCVDDEIFPAILSMDDPAIAHIAEAEGSNPGGFEILDPASTAGLGLDCDPFVTGSLFDGGLKGFASAAPRYIREAAASLFLPTKAQAAASALGKTGLGGLARSLSPFGVVDRSAGEVSLTHLDPEYSSEREGTSVIRRVQLLSGDDPIQGQPVTFTTDNGTFDDSEDQDSTVVTDADGQASVTWYLPDDPTVAGMTASASDVTISYTVAIADGEELTALPCSLEGTIRSLNSTTPVNVRFTNDLGPGDDQVSVFWLNTNGQREFPFEGGGLGVPYNVLDPTGSDSSYVQPTFRTHPWVLTTPGGETGVCQGIFLPLPPTEVGEGEADGGEAVVQPTF